MMEEVVAENRDYSEPIEDFLKTVYHLQHEHGLVPTSVLAKALDITPPSTTEMAKKLAKANLIEHTPYQGVCLTPMGQRIALEIVRNHRLLELFLVRALDYSWDEVHEEAERLEHAVSERLAQRIAEYLGNPRYDPHGDPIPSAEGEVAPRALTALSEWPADQSGIVARLRDQSPDMLRYLAEKGLTVGAAVQVISTDPFDGPITLTVDGVEQVIGPNVAQIVLVGQA